MTDPLVIEIPYTPRAAFVDFHERQQRWAVIVAHRRAGKTVACINELIRAAVRENKRDGRYAYIAPFYAQAKDIAWTYLKQFTSGFDAVGRTVNESELRVHLRNGAQIRLYGADNPDALRGIYLDGVVLDEPADMKPSLWTAVVRPLLSDRKGWAVFIGTPKGDNSFRELFMQASADPNWYTMTLRASRSGLIDEEELRDNLRAMGEDLFNQEFECSFDAAITGAYWGKEFAAAEDEERICEVSHIPELPVETAWDIGRTDDTVIWFWQVLRGQVRVIDYYSTNGESAGHYARMLQSKPYTYKRHWLPHDAFAKTAAAERSFEEQLFAYSVKPVVRVAPHGVQDGIQSARALLPRCWFDAAKCADGIKALKQYRREWDEGKKAFRDKPKHDWTSHAADAFRYFAVSMRDEMPELKPIKINTRQPTIKELMESDVPSDPYVRI